MTDDGDFQAATLGSLVQARNMAAQCLWSGVHVLILPWPNTFNLLFFFLLFSNFFLQSKKTMTAVGVSATGDLSGV